MKRSIVIRGHATSLSLEPEFWAALKSIAGAQGLSLAGLVATVDAARAARVNLSSALRVFVLKSLQKR